MDAHDGLDEARSAARKVNDHPALETLARVGFVVTGLLHIVIGYISVRVAWGGGGGQADQAGALATLASNPAGTVLMWVIVIGLLALALWQVTTAFVPAPGFDDVTDRVKGLAKAIMYGVLAFTALQFALGSGSSSSSEESSQDVTATLMEQPAGQVLVGAVGVGVLVIGAIHAYTGLSQKFLDQLEEDPGRWTTGLGMVGYPAKGLVLGLVGVFFLVAALKHQSSEAEGLDGALKSVRDQPFGPYLLTIVAIGLVAFGLYCIARARHQRI